MLKNSTNFTIILLVGMLQRELSGTTIILQMIRIILMDRPLAKRTVKWAYVLFANIPDHLVVYILSEFAPLEFTFPIPTNCCFLSNQEGWQHRWSLPGGFRIWKSAFRDSRWEAMGAEFHPTLPWHLAIIPPSAVSSFLISTSISSTTASSLLASWLWCNIDA